MDGSRKNITMTETIQRRTTNNTCSLLYTVPSSNIFRCETTIWSKHKKQESQKVAGKALEKGPAVWCWYEGGSGEKWDISWENGKIVNTTEEGERTKSRNENVWKKS